MLVVVLGMREKKIKWGGYIDGSLGLWLKGSWVSS